MYTVYKLYSKSLSHFTKNSYNDAHQHHIPQLVLVHVEVPFILGHPCANLAIITGWPRHNQRQNSP